MPYRHEPCVTGETYHVFNRSVAGQTIFTNSRDYQRFINLLSYYRYRKPPTRYSEYARLSLTAQQEIQQRLEQSNQQATMLAFCCMPNHFHMLLTQKEDNGIATFLSQVENGYAKYFNVKNKRFGALFQSMFKAVRMETEEQLLHVARYIHLNPLTAQIVPTFEDLMHYPWSSLGHYFNATDGSLVDTSVTLSHFRSLESFRQYMEDQADHQRLLFVESHLYHDSNDG